jgi:wyosine [tRNA(Phe)-imidazoG37] synthetase (radical SAM superfamily)
MIAFGPVPSRRLGRSLGINNIPPKVCSYSCVYCQVGRTSKLQIARQQFFSTEEIFQETRFRVRQVQQLGERIDYLSFVPDGEPTLDVQLGKEIDLLRTLDIKIAVITNSSLLWIPRVRHELCKADVVSIKLDTLDESAWHRLNRPHRRLSLNNILEGILFFRKEYHGQLLSETMLIRGMNEDELMLQQLADFLGRLKPAKAYLSIPIRPPAEKHIRPISEKNLIRAYEIFREKIQAVELLTGEEGDEFAFTGDAENDLLSITAVHPMRKEAVRVLLGRAGQDWSMVRKLIGQGKLREIKHKGQYFLVRKIV